MIEASTPGLRILPLGGLGEIGMNCLILEYEDEIIVVDCGLLFSDLDHLGVEFAIPNFDYLKERVDKVRAFVITHGHEDHIGALPFALKAGIRAPIYCSHFTSLLIRERLKEHVLDTQVDLHVFKMEERISFKHFKFTPVSVNHSIVDSSALFIETPFGMIVHTGDFKIDPTPFYGKMMDLDRFKKAGDEGVLLLLSDSTNVERHSHSMSEKKIYHKFEELFAAAEGMIIVAMFSSNVARMGQVFEIAKKLGKKVALAGRSMEQNVRLGQEAGFLKDVPSVWVPTEELETLDRKKVILLSTGSQAEHRSALIRISMGEHGTIKLEKNDLVLMSSKFIPGNEKAIGKMINQLFRQGAEVLYEAVHDIHVSGHATRPELKQMIELVKPKFFIPIHGEYRHLVHHAKLAKEAGLKEEQILIAVNGDIVNFGPDSMKKVEHLEDHRILIENREGHEISKIVLKTRRQLGETGVAFLLLVRNAESRKIVAGPEIIMKGLVHEEREVQLITEVKQLIRQTVNEYEKTLQKGQIEHDLQETLRVAVRRFLKQFNTKKPLVFPLIIDV